MVTGIQKGSIKFMLFLFFLVGEQGIAMDDDLQEKSLINNITPANPTPNDTSASSLTSFELQNPTQLPVLPRLIIPHNPYAEEITNVKTIQLSEIMGENPGDYMNEDNKCDLSRYESDSLLFKIEP